MNLKFSVDKLYETNWQPRNPAQCPRLDDGRFYPSLDEVQSLFSAHGYSLTIRYAQLFDCYRAVWANSSGAPEGAVVGTDETEAAVYALAQWLKECPHVHAPSHTP